MRLVCFSFSKTEPVTYIFLLCYYYLLFAFNALTLLVGSQEEHLAFKK